MNKKELLMSILNTLSIPASFNNIPADTSLPCVVWQEENTQTFARSNTHKIRRYMFVIIVYSTDPIDIWEYEEALDKALLKNGFIFEQANNTIYTEPVYSKVLRYSITTREQ